MNELPTYVRAHAGGASLQVKVAPRASRNEIGEVQGDRLKIKITAPPVDSAANEELVAFLAKQLGVGRGAVQIIQGQASRNKTLAIRGLDALAVVNGLREKS
jgi:uncharacterized protein (TIGR00251 family)